MVEHAPSRPDATRVGGSADTSQSLLDQPLQCSVVTPEETVLEQPAEFIALPLYDGEIGIAPGHSPLIGRLGFGELRVVSGGQTARYYVDGGFVQVADNAVSILTSRAVRAQDLNSAAAAEQLAAARTQSATTDEEIAARERAQLQARAQLRLAQRGK